MSSIQLKFTLFFTNNLIICGDKQTGEDIQVEEGNQAEEDIRAEEDNQAVQWRRLYSKCIRLHTIFQLNNNMQLTLIT